MPVASPFYFALISEGEVFGSEHLRMDWYIFKFAYSHEESKNAALTVTIKNPGIGLLSTSLWCYFACDFGSGPQLLFKGLIAGLMTDLFGPVVDVLFIARPSDQEAQKAIIAPSLKVRPNWDPLFIDASHQDDPDTLLQGYSRLWYINPISLAVSTSDILVGTAGTRSFGASDALYHSVQCTIEGNPINSISGKIAVPWTQGGSGSVSIAPQPFTGSGVANDWPHTGDSISGGYTVGLAKVQADSDIPIASGSVSYQNGAKTHQDGDTISISESWSAPASSMITQDSLRVFDLGHILAENTRTVVGDPETGTAAEAHLDIQGILGFTGSSTVSMVLNYVISAKHTETVNISVQSEIQPIVGDPATTAKEELNIDASAADLDPAGSFNSGSWTYFGTDRGRWSIEYWLCRATARLAIGARVGRVSWKCPLVEVRGLTVDWNAQLTDPRLSNGVAEGKVIKVTMDGDGNTGSFLGGVTIACAIGTGVAWTPSSGSPVYVAPGYVGPGYQAQDGLIIPVGAGNVGYTPPATPISNLQGPLGTGSVVVSAVRHSRLPTAADILQQAADAGRADNSGEANVFPGVPSTANIIAQKQQTATDFMQKAMTEAGQWFELTLLDLTAEQPAVEYDVTTTTFTIPEQIDLS